MGSRVRHIGVTEAHQMMRESRAALIDVRERNEFRSGRARGATRISLGQLEEQIHRVPTDRPVLVICRSGNRSARACKQLARHGIEATNVRGGTIAWKAAKLPMSTGGS
jgi:rhodanese-related sulfurtransferase